jgi:large subunit ribosomal protein L10
MRPEKLQLSKDIAALLEATGSAFMVAYKGLKVSEFGDLRRGLTALGSECHVVPNRILRRTAAGLGLKELADLAFTGETALVTGGADPARCAKFLKGFAKDHPSLVFRFGLLDRRLITGADVQALAELPPREVLLAQLLGVLQGPARQLVSVLNAKTASILYVLRAYVEKKEQAA